MKAAINFEYLHLPSVAFFSLGFPFRKLKSGMFIQTTTLTELIKNITSCTANFSNIYKLSLRPFAKPGFTKTSVSSQALSRQKSQ
jgi:hypothetical protein